MSVLVTGGAGYIGGHMTLGPLDAGEKVVVLDDLSTGFDWAVNEPARLVVGDTGDADLVARLIDEHEIDAIAHFAAKIVVPNSLSDPLGYYLNNTSNARTLIETAIKGGVKHFIFSSTAAVYGETSAEPVSEDTPLAPISPYGRSKLMVEWMLEDAARAYDFRFVALRYFNVAGADPEGRLGQSTPKATHLIKRGVQTALGIYPSMEIFGQDYPTRDGTCVRDYIQVTDLIDAHMAALRLSAQRRREHGLQLRLWPRADGPGGRRRGQARLGGRLQGDHVAAPPRRPRRHRRARRPGEERARLAAGARQSRRHRAPGARLGAPPAQPPAGASSLDGGRSHAPSGHALFASPRLLRLYNRGAIRLDLTRPTHCGGIGRGMRRATGGNERETIFSSPRASPRASAISARSATSPCAFGAGRSTR